MQISQSHFKRNKGIKITDNVREDRMNVFGKYNVLTTNKK